MKKFLIGLFLYVSLSSVAEAKIIYVKGNASGAADGSSWSNAFTSIHSAISAAIFGDSIWVSSGTYKPSTFDRNVSFNLKNGVYLFGGFAGSETSLSQRNHLLNITTLSGDIGTGGVITDNTYHIVTAYNLNFTTTIDGFRIMDGNATTGHPYGAGIDVDEAKLVVRNCSFLNNTTVADGAAIYMWNESLLVENCSFLYNSSSGSGAAISCNVGTARIINCVFTGNESTAGGGGAIENSGEDLFIDRCIFSGNSCDGSGAAVLSSGVSHMDTVINSVFVGNVSYWGSVVELVITSNFTGDASVAVINCTVAHNNSLSSISNPSYEGALRLSCGNSPEVVYNTIVWGNRALVPIQGPATAAIFNCITDQSTLTNNGCLFTNPLFVNPASAASQAPFFISSFDYHLQATSPGIDNGFASYPWVPYTRDVDSISRPYGTKTDIGAYENNYCTFAPVIAVTGDSVFCNGQSATLTAPAGLNYLWSNNSTAQSINVNASGSYNLFMVDSSFCRGNVSKQITVTTSNVPINNLGTDTFCNGTTVQLEAQANGSYSWNTGATSAVITISNSGLYAVTVTDSAGCISTGSRSVSKSSPSVSVSGQNFFCSGGSTTLTATTQPANGFNWSNGLQTSTASVNQAGTYTLTVTAPGNCTASASFNVTEQQTVVPSVAVNVANNGVCQGQAISFSATPANGGSAPAYLWRKNGTSTGFAGNPYISSTLNDGDVISVQMTSNAQCATPASVLSPSVTAVVYTTPTQPVISQSGNLLSSSAATGNQWYLNGIVISGATSSALLATATGFYSVEVTSANGCTSPASAALYIDLTGFNTLDTETYLQIFPNPAALALYIQSSSTIERVAVYNTSGVLLMEHSEYSLPIDISQLAKGIYVLKVSGPQGILFRKFIKEK